MIHLREGQKVLLFWIVTLTLCLLVWTAVLRAGELALVIQLANEKRSRAGATADSTSTQR